MFYEFCARLQKLLGLVVINILACSKLGFVDRKESYRQFLLNS
jgi:hypothetical protein